MTERVRLAQEAMRESQDPGRYTDHVVGEHELPQQPTQSSEHEPSVAPLPEEPDVFVPDPDFRETPGDPVHNAETFDDYHDEQTPAEPVPHISSPHWERR